ncbi:MAG: DUF2231 domain-containing protein [Mycobacteriales bacterium]
MKPFDQIDSIGSVRILDVPARGLDVLSRLVPRGPIQSVLAGTPFGHSAHPMLVQMPIGAWVSAGWLDCLPSTEKPAAVLTAVGIAAAVPALAAGLVDYAALGPQQRRIAVVHATANVLALGSQALSLNDRLRGRLRRAQWVGLVGTLTLAAGGMLGGHLAHRLTAAGDVT